MRVLVIKLTSMGDILHLFPALSDLQKKFPKADIDWMVEDSFAEIPLWHPSVSRVICAGTRRWRRLTWQNMKEFSEFIRSARHDKYDYVIDAQGLMKSAVLSRFVRLNKNGKRIGFSADSIKESPAAKLYRKKVTVSRDLHAIERLRQLFSQGFDYSISFNKNERNVESSLRAKLNYQVRLPGKLVKSLNQRTIFFLHGTTWPSKHLPDQVWRDLLDLVTDDGYQVKLCWGNETERKRASWIAHEKPNVEVLPKQSLTDLAKMLKIAAGVISVDTGLGHLAAAMNVPAVTIYGSTDAKLTGAIGAEQNHLQTNYPCSPCLLKHCNKITDQVLSPPCYQTVSAVNIWQALYEKIA